MNTIRLGLAACVLCVSTVYGHATSLRDAVSRAVHTNPDVLESAANRRARDYELRRSQSAFLPTLNLDASIGPEVSDSPNSSLRSQNNVWRNGRQVSITARQLIFDGLGSVNEIYRQSARVDGAALRVIERSEAIALDAIEAYLDVLRHREILAEARRNVQKQRRILGDVSQRVTGGETGRADEDQARERVFAAEIIVSEIDKLLRDAMAKYRRVVGSAPKGLRGAKRAASPGRSLRGLINDAMQNHPRVQVADADADAALYEYKSTKSTLLPRVFLEGNAKIGSDIDGIEGRNDDYSAKVVLSWNLFSGGANRARRREFGERYGEAQIAVDRARREVVEALERAWAAVKTGDQRIHATSGQVASNRSVVDGYWKQYDIGQRTLLDVLNAENALFTSKIDLISAVSVVKFSTYQLRATYGDLLDYLGVSPPQEATAGRREDVSIFPQKVPFKLEPIRKF